MNLCFVFFFFSSRCIADIVKGPSVWCLWSYGKWKTTSKHLCKLETEKSFKRAVNCLQSLLAPCLIAGRSIAVWCLCFTIYFADSSEENANNFSWIAKPIESSTILYGQWMQSGFTSLKIKEKSCIQTWCLWFMSGRQI